MAGLYIHIPFCRSKCYYCDFFSSPAYGYAERFVDALIAEWKLRRHELNEPIETIYLGGGTPTVLPDSLTAKLVEAIEKDVGIANLTEFTIEANPEDISRERLLLWQQIGINRISIGIQSFNDAELKIIGRRHDSPASAKALSTLKEHGINFSADLMYGLPSQNIEDWNKNLTRLLSFNPPHFSAYLLSYEPGTRLYAIKERGGVKEASEELACEMYALLCNKAADAGYNHYEISNFAMPGARAKHNSSYWDLTPYIGLGPAAHSFDGIVRRHNPWDIKKYMNSLLDDYKACHEIDEENERNRVNDYIVTSLRTSNGFNLPFANKKFGKPFTDEFVKNANILMSRTPIGKEAPICIASDGTFFIPEHLWLKSDAIMRELII